MNSAPATGHTANASETWQLKVLSGTHAGASRRCGHRDVLLLGSTDDCDLILTDTGVGLRHCLLTFADGRVFARAIDAPVTLAGRVLAPGSTPRPMEPMQELLVGSVRICLGPEDDERWPDKAPVAEPDPTDAAPGQTRVWVLAGAVTLALVAAVALLWGPPAPPPDIDVGAERLGAVEAILATLPGHEVTAALDDELRPQLRGFVADGATAAQLRAQLALLPFAVDEQVRNGERIAGDVAEVMRLSGLAAQSSWLGAGRVEVRGAFAEQQRLQQALDSPQMAAVAGLREVVPVNTVPPAERETDPSIEPRFRIVRVQSGADPFIVTADGGHFYVGAALPTGEQLLAISEDHMVTFSREKGVRRLDLRERPGGAPP
ncbi:MAG: FHA domain-containing protein [Lysobacteraceae bacterium]